MASGVPEFENNRYKSAIVLLDPPDEAPILDAQFEGRTMALTADGICKFEGVPSVSAAVADKVARARKAKRILMVFMMCSPVHRV